MINMRTYRSLVDLGCLGMMLTTSAIRVQRMGVSFWAVKGLKKEQIRGGKDGWGDVWWFRYMVLS